MTEFEKKLSQLNGIDRVFYGALVNRKLRARYSLWDEIALLRQKDQKPEEYAAYCAYAEECKAAAKAEIYGEEESE